MASPPPRRRDGRVPAVARLATAFALLAAVSMAAYGGTAAAEKLRIGNLVIEAGGNFKPRKLPKRTRVPIALSAWATVNTDDGSTPPAVEELVLDFDSNGTVYSKGKPKCPPRRIANTTTRQALHRCGAALVGHGRVKGIVDFPEDEPFEAGGWVLAFNAQEPNGRPQLLFHAYAHVPAPTTYVVPVWLRRAPGRRYGVRAIVRPPEVANGHGSITLFRLKLNRRWWHDGRPRSFAMANCRHWQMIVRGRVAFDDGTGLSGRLFRACEAR